MGPDQQLAHTLPIDQRISYSAVSHTSYTTDPQLTSLSRSWYSRLPDGRNPQSIALAREMRAAAGSDQRYIESVLRRFHDEDYYYTLQPPPLGRDPVDQFLFGTRRGFCEHYASAFAVLMRAAGIPSRIVLGYQGGELNPLGNYMIVRQSDAHAWTEVWLPERGWHRVDPTAAVAPERIESGMSGVRFDAIGESWGLDAPAEWLYRLTLSWDALNARWNEWVLGYGPENQRLFMQWLGMEQPDWQKMLFTLLALVALGIVAVSVVLLLRNRPPPKDPAAILYAQFTHKAGLPPHTGETPQHYAERLRQRPGQDPRGVDRVTTHYLAARYGAPDQRALQELKSAVVEFRRSA